ncbi:unnamed protein product [Arabidopsis lyrata]|nr:unnamed protein product [Arabidopsis lyrata]
MADIDLSSRLLRTEKNLPATVAIQGFIHALVLVFVEAMPAILSVGCDRTEPESDDEHMFPVDVLSIIPSADVVTGVEDCGWVDEVSDPSVQVLLKRLEEGVKFSR